MSKTFSEVKSGAHTVKQGKKVKVRATIGFGQKGGWVMLLGGKQIAGGTAPKWVALGDGADLDKKELEVSAVMTDVQASTNKLALTIDVAGPGSSKTVISNTGGDGDNAAYVIFVKFSK